VARVDKRKQAAVRPKLAVHPDDLMERGGVDERKPGQVDKEQAGLLGGFCAQHVTEDAGGHVGLADKPHHRTRTARAVLRADGHRQLSHASNYVILPGGQRNHERA
jgi:hypothetical protein